MLIVTEAVTDGAAKDLNAVPWNEWIQDDLLTLICASLERQFPRPWYLVGPPSSAKSYIMAQACRLMSTDKIMYHFIDDRVSQKDPTEIRGVYAAPSDPKAMSARLLVTPEYVILWNDCEPCKKAGRECRVVLFYDEHNHAADIVQKACYEPVHDASIGGRKFKRGVTRTLAGNREGDNCNIVVADRPLRSRVGWVYVRHHFDSFYKHIMADSKVERPVFPAFTPPPTGVWHPYVVGWLKERGAEVAFVPGSDEAEYFGEALSRTWEFVSDALWYFEDALHERLIKKIVAGFVGPGMAAQFWTWCRTAGRLLPIIDEITEAGSNKTAPTMGQQFFVVHCLMERFRRNGKKLAGRLLDYCLAIKKTHGEMGGFLLKRMVEFNRDALKATGKKYVEAKDAYYTILV